MARGALSHAITKLNKYSMNHLKNVAKESSLFSTAKVRRFHKLCNTQKLGFCLSHPQNNYQSRLIINRYHLVVIQILILIISDQRVV